MFRWTLVCGLLTCTGLFGCAQFDAHRAPPPPPARPPGPPHPELVQEQARCPVTGRPVNFLVRTDGPQGRVYFCAPECLPTYRAAPEQYADAVAWQREILSYKPRVQVLCPVSGEPVDPRRFADVEGQRVYFCEACGACKTKYEDHPARYATALEASYTYQTRSPVTGVRISPAAYTTTPSGARIYFCCAACANKLLREPERYAHNLEAQGVRLDADTLKEHG